MSHVVSKNLGANEATSHLTYTSGGVIVENYAFESAQKNCIQIFNRENE